MNEKGMSVIVKTIARLTGGLIMLFGIYVVLHGHLTPGGGFPGGVMMASAFILIVLAEGKERAFKLLTPGSAGILESGGGLVFLVVGLIGLTGGYFLFNWLPKGEAFALPSAGTIPVINLGIGMKVLGALFSVFGVFALGEFGREQRR